MALSKVRFAKGLQADYDALPTKNPDMLYFILDTHCIYCGDKLFGTGYIDKIEQTEASKNEESIVIDSGGAPQE